MSLWYAFGPWLNGRYPPAEILISIVTQIPSIAYIFWFLLGVSGTLFTFLSSMSYLVLKEEKKSDSFLLSTYFLIYPIRTK